MWSGKCETFQDWGLFVQVVLHCVSIFDKQIVDIK